MARPKGSKDKKPRKKAIRPAVKKSPARKTPAKVAGPPKEAQPIEDVVITPWPRAGDNPLFEGLCDQVERAVRPEPSTRDNKEAITQPELRVEDLAEWVSWPFSIWSSVKKMPDLKITNVEAKSVAEPLTRILNRHGVAETVSPDLIDGLCVAGRLVPILSAKHLLIRAERTRRAKAGQTQGRARGHGSPAPQGMPRTD